MMRITLGSSPTKVESKLTTPLPGLDAMHWSLGL